MKQKVVVKLSVHDEKSRSKAMKTAVGVDGVDSASLPQDKNQIEVTGNDIDVVLLITLLRKSVKYAEVVSVSAVKAEEKKDEKPKVTDQVIVAWPQSYPVAANQWQCPPHDPYQQHYSDPGSSCNIM